MHPGPILFCGDPHGQWQHIIDAALQTRVRAVILLGDLEPARPLHIELEAIWERVWFIHGNHDTDHADNFANVWHDDVSERNLHGRTKARFSSVRGESVFRPGWCRRGCRAGD